MVPVQTRLDRSGRVLRRERVRGLDRAQRSGVAVEQPVAPAPQPVAATVVAAPPALQNRNKTGVNQSGL